MIPKLPLTIFGENKDDPFEGDLFNRKEEIENLTPMMIENIPSPMVMALNAQWGAGKTAFVKMWTGYLAKKQIPALYFNAWETDYAPDPLVPFMAAITEQLSDGKDELANQAKAILSAIVGDITGKLIGGGTAQFAEQSMKKILKHPEQIKAFQDALKSRAEKDGRVVIFVDELDRCRPDYAIKLLERIKHLFEVQGLIFILAINRPQLCSSVRALYGADIDANTYLHRFIDFDFTIQQPNMAKFILSRLEKTGVAKVLEERKMTNDDHRYDYSRLHESLILLARICNYSPRDADQLLTRVVFVLRALKENGANYECYFYPAFVAFLVMLRLTEPEHYNNFILPTDNGDELVKYWENKLQQADFKYRHDGVNEPHIAASITAHIITTKFDSHKKPINPTDIADSYNQRKMDANTRGETDYCNYVSSFISHDSSSYRVNLPRLVNKIEMLDKFNFPTSDTSENKNN